MGDGLRPTLFVERLVIDPRVATYDGRPLRLSRKQNRVLYELARERASLSRATLIARCWSRPVRLGSVNVMVCRLRRKLEGTRLAIVDTDDGYMLLVPREKRILVVDDEERVRSAYRRLLARVDAKIDEARSIAEALELIAQESHDACFLDLLLPDGCGSTLIEPLRRRHRHTAIMIVTGRNDPQAIRFSKEFGVAYAEKPLEGASLVRFAERALQAD